MARAHSSTTSATNPANNLDVDDSGYVSAADALNVIEVINTNGSGYVLETFRSEVAAEWPFYDTSGNNVVSALDVLLIIAELNVQAGMAGGGEGEAADVQIVASDSLASIGTSGTAVTAADPIEGAVGAGEEAETGISTNQQPGFSHGCRASFIRAGARTAPTALVADRGGRCGTQKPDASACGLGSREK